MKVLSTKTLDTTSLDYARSLGFNVSCVDFIETKKTNFLLSTSNFDAIVFTSANAVEFFAEHLEKCEKISVFSLSGKTNDALLKHNIDAIFTADNAEELSGRIIQSSVKSVLHVCGNLVLETLHERLKNAEIEYQQLIVYNTRLLPQKVDSTLFDAILFFSPSGVESFFSSNEISEKTISVAIGKTTENTLKTRTENSIIIADKPSVEEMFDKLAKHFVI